jgi:tRNA threonylcarbamoyl adenosine modification protein (Sua5/YciO/YrdC/YwlC family)
MPWDGADPRVLDEALAALRRGALMILPTDTVYGVAADPCVPGAEQRLCAAKGRAGDKPIPLLAADCRQIEQWPARLSPTARALAGRYWPGALTMVLGTGTNHWEGFRIPNHAGAMALLRGIGSPLRVTSANRSGAAEALTVQEAVQALGDSAELALDMGPSPGGRPSTVIRIENDNITILREGAIPGSEILAMHRQEMRDQAST